MKIASKHDVLLLLVPFVLACLLLLDVGQRTPEVSQPSLPLRPTKAPSEASRPAALQGPIVVMEDRLHGSEVVHPLKGTGWTHTMLHNGQEVLTVAWTPGPDPSDGKYDFEVTDHTAPHGPRVVQKQAVDAELVRPVYESDDVAVRVSSTQIERSAR